MSLLESFRFIPTNTLYAAHNKLHSGCGQALCSDCLYDKGFLKKKQELRLFRFSTLSCCSVVNTYTSLNDSIIMPQESQPQTVVPRPFRSHSTLPILIPTKLSSWWTITSIRFSWCVTKPAWLSFCELLVVFSIDSGGAFSILRGSFIVSVTAVTMSKS